MWRAEPALGWVHVGGLAGEGAKKAAKKREPFGSRFFALFLCVALNLAAVAGTGFILWGAFWLAGGFALAGWRQKKREPFGSRFLCLGLTAVASPCFLLVGVAFG